jgi:hypothetical protein
MEKFILYFRDKNLGNLEFKDGIYIFKPNPDISHLEWERFYNIIPISNNSTTIKSKKLFDQLNLRLPPKIRSEKEEKKIDYIKKSNLRVISDSYQLVAA